MYIDKKTEENYAKLREHKENIDKRMKIISGLMVAMPIFVIVVALIATFPEAARRILTDSHRTSYRRRRRHSPASALVLCIFALSEALAGTKMPTKAAPFIYFGEFVLGILMFIKGSYIVAVLFIILSAASFVLNYIYKKLEKEDDELKTLDGYPHFNPLLTSKIKASETARKKYPTDMTPEERIMYERENY